MFDRIRATHRFAAVIVLIMVAGLRSTSAQTTTWYVGPYGVNGTACGAPATPCATVNYVLSNKVAPGQTIRVLAGTYTNQGNISFTGSNQANVTLTADDPANRPQFLNTRISVGNGVSGVTISYLRVRAAAVPTDDYYGVIEVAEYPTIIDHNELWNGGQGVLIRTSQQVTISNNDIHNLGLADTDYDTHCITIANWQQDPVASGFATAIRITGNSLHDCGGDGLQENSWSEVRVQFNYLLIDGNSIYNNEEQGIDTKGTDDLRIYNNDIYGNGYGGIGNNAVHGSTARWDIDNNRIHDHTAYAIFDQGGGAAWKIWNNLIYNNLTAPPYNYCAVHLPSDTASVFYNNTVVNNTDASGALQTCGITAGSNAGNIVNNLFYNNGAGSNDRGNIRNIWGEDSGTPRNNYVYPASCGNGGQCQTGTNAVTACQLSGNCPGFVNLSAADFHLKSDSPAKDRASLLAAVFALDFDGGARGQGLGWDIGAFEFGASTTLKPEAPLNLRIIKP